METGDPERNLNQFGTYKNHLLIFSSYSSYKLFYSRFLSALSPSWCIHFLERWQKHAAACQYQRGFHASG